MFGYKIYRTTDGLIKHDMWYNDDKNNIFVRNKFNIRDLLEETVTLIVQQKHIKFRSIELSELNGGRASITVNGSVTVMIEWNNDRDEFEIFPLQNMVVSPVRLCMLMLSPTFILGDYDEKEKK
jgi:hypothetical protein